MELPVDEKVPQKLFEKFDGNSIEGLRRFLDGSEVADSRPKSRRRRGLSPFKHGVARHEHRAGRADRPRHLGPGARVGARAGR